MVGFVIVAQQIPLSVIIPPPSVTILPPLIAEVVVIPEIEFVETEGSRTPPLMFSFIMLL